MSGFLDMTVIVPAYNEESCIQKTLRELSAEYPGAELIVVDNDSRDGTVAQVLALANPDLRLSRCAIRGKGAAMQQGLSMASRPLVMFHDADGEYRAKDGHPLVAWARNNPNAMAVGNRTFSVGGPPWSSLLACALVRWALSVRHNVVLNDQDILSGTRIAPLKVWRSLGLSSAGFSIETQIVKQCILNKITLQGFPVSYTPRTKEAGKKIRVWDLLSLLRIALG